MKVKRDLYLDDLGGGGVPAEKRETGEKGEGGVTVPESFRRMCCWDKLLFRYNWLLALVCI